MSKDETRRRILAVTALAVTTAFFAGCSPKDIPDEDLYGPEYSTTSEVSPIGDDEPISETSSSEDGVSVPISSSDGDPITSSSEDSTAAPKTSSNEDSESITSKPETSEQISSSRDDDPTTSSSSEDSTGEPPVPSSGSNTSSSTTAETDVTVTTNPMSQDSIDKIRAIQAEEAKNNPTTPSSGKPSLIVIPVGTKGEYFDQYGNPMPSNFDPSNGGYYDATGCYHMTPAEQEQMMQELEREHKQIMDGTFSGTSGMSKEDADALLARLGL